LTDRDTAARPAEAPAGRGAGTALLVAGLGAAGALAFQHVAGTGLPGCGAVGPCAEAAAGRRGSVGGWPVSYLGLASFAGLLAAWTDQGRGGVGPGLRLVARAGALVSAVYLAVTAAGGHGCVYCLVVHAANLAFRVRAERAPASAASAYPALAFATIFGLTSVALGVAEARSGATFQTGRRA